MLHLVHEAAHVVGHRIHAQRIEAAVKHVGLYAHLIERLTESTNSVVRIFTGKQINLFKGSSVRFNTREATHVDDCRSNTFELVFARLELA